MDLYLIMLSRIRICIGNADPDPGAINLLKFINKPDFRHFKKAFLPTST